MYSLGISLVFCDILLNIATLHHKNGGVNSCGSNVNMENRTTSSLIQKDGLHGDGNVLRSHSIAHGIQTYMENNGVLVEKPNCSKMKCTIWFSKNEFSEVRDFLQECFSNFWYVCPDTDPWYPKDHPDVKAPTGVYSCHSISSYLPHSECFICSDEVDKISGAICRGLEMSLSDVFILSTVVF